MVPENKIHDLHPAIRPSGLYWTTTLAASNLNISQDGRTATLEVNNLTMIDEPKFPKAGPASSATMSFKIVWTATGSPVAFSNADKHFSVLAAPAQARASFKVAVPSDNFTWTSDPLETSTSTDGLLGMEVNGSFYEQGYKPGQRAAGGGVTLPHSGGGGGYSARVEGNPGLGLELAASGGILALAGLGLVLRRFSRHTPSKPE